MPSGEPVNPASVVDQVFTAVIAGSSMRYPKTLKALGDWTPSHPRAQWPNSYVDAREFLIQYGEKGEGGF